jgi:hypothetical protein
MHLSEYSGMLTWQVPIYISACRLQKLLFQSRVKKVSVRLLYSLTYFITFHTQAFQEFCHFISSSLSNLFTVWLISDLILPCVSLCILQLNVKHGVPLLSSTHSCAQMAACVHTRYAYTYMYAQSCMLMHAYTHRVSCFLTFVLTVCTWRAYSRLLYTQRAACFKFRNFLFILYIVSAVASVSFMNVPVFLRLWYCKNTSCCLRSW